MAVRRILAQDVGTSFPEKELRSRSRRREEAPLLECPLSRRSTEGVMPRPLWSGFFLNLNPVPQLEPDPYSHVGVRQAFSEPISTGVARWNPLSGKTTSTGAVRSCGRRPTKTGTVCWVKSLLPIERQTIARGLPAWAGAHSPVSLVPKPGTGIRLLCRSCLMSSAPGPRKRGLFF